MTQTAADHYAKGHPSPAAANVLASANIPIESVVGTGKNGRITKADAEAAKATVPASQPVDTTSESQADLLCSNW